MDALRNRLLKNHRKLAPWAKRVPTDAWRLYDRDIPEFPLIIDIYGDHFLIHDRSDAVLDAGKDLVGGVTTILIEQFNAKPEKIVLKRRERKVGTSQYEKIDETGRFFTVQEGLAKFRVNLHDYLDTGLFLDHRPLRQKILKSAPTHPRILNLFCYTGSISVAAALGGAFVESVDMNGNYLDWARENFALNSLNPKDHRFTRANVLEFLADPPGRERFDLIVLDPPTFSNSKKMSDSFEVERDQEFLVHSCMSRLSESGVLYFSNNKRSFRLSDELQSKYSIRDISTSTIPQDFHDKKIHRCYEIHGCPPR